MRADFASVASTTTRQEAIAKVIENAIDAGTLMPGTRLPTVRAFSNELAVSASTVLAAYNLLRSRGRISGEVGRGTFVKARPAQPPSAVSGSGFHGHPSASEKHPPWRRRTVQSSATRLISAHPRALDCTRGKPDTSLIAADAIARAAKNAASQVDAADLQYAGPSPIPALRKALLPRLKREGIADSSCEIVVGSSAQQLMVMSLSLAGRLRPNGPRVVAVEEPGYQTVFDAFEYLGYTLVGMELDDQGVLPSSLDAALRKGASAALFTPCAVNPLGVSWTEERRHAIAQVLGAHPNTLAIEDDQFADLATTRPGSLLGTPVGERSVYIRSFSKSIAPDIRVAVAVACPRLANLLGEAKSILDGWTSHMSQRILAHVLTDPDTDIALNRARESYCLRRTTITDILNNGLAGSGAKVSGSDGLNVWIELPIGTTASAVIDRAAELGVLLVSGEPFYIRPGQQGVIRMSISGISDSQSADAAKRVVQAIQTGTENLSMAIPI